MASKENPGQGSLVTTEENNLRFQIERYLLDIQETEQNLTDFLRQRKELESQLKDEGSPSRRSQLSYAQRQLYDEVESLKVILADLRVKLQDARNGIEVIHKRKALCPLFLARVNAYNRCLVDLFVAADELLSVAMEARSNNVDLRIQGLLGTAAGHLNRRADLLPRTVIRLDANQSGIVRAAFIDVERFVTGVKPDQ